MSALIVGIDFSADRFDAALIPADPDDGSDAPAVTLRQYELPRFPKDSSGKYLSTPAFRTVERCRVVRDAMRELLQSVGYVQRWGLHGPTWDPIHEVVHVCVETPLGSKSRSTVLWELYGAILASIPSNIERDTYRTVDWRNDLWPPGHTVIFDGNLPTAPGLKGYAIMWAKEQTGVPMDEHQAEAYCVARACRKRLDEAFVREAS